MGRQSGRVEGFLNVSVRCHIVQGQNGVMIVMQEFHVFGKQRRVGSDPIVGVVGHAMNREYDNFFRERPVSSRS